MMRIEDLFSCEFCAFYDGDRCECADDLTEGDVNGRMTACRLFKLCEGRRHLLSCDTDSAPCLYCRDEGCGMGVLVRSEFG